MGEIADDIIDDGLLNEDDEGRERYDPTEYWEDGRHKTSDGEVIKIKDMTDAHLSYAIRHFQRDFDVSILRKELKRRANKKK